MRGRSFNPDEATRVKILQGLIALRKDGHFAAIDANLNTIRIQFEPGGYWKLIGWRRAWEMVDTARQVATAPLIVTARADKKAPAAERSQRAQPAKRA